MLNYNDLKAGHLYGLRRGQPYVVMIHFLRMQQRKPVVRPKSRNIIASKNSAEKKLSSLPDKFEEAEIRNHAYKNIFTTIRANTGSTKRPIRAPDSKLEENIVPVL